MLLDFLRATWPGYALGAGIGLIVGPLVQAWEKRSWRKTCEKNGWEIDG